MTQLTRLHSAMVVAGVWGAIIRQFFVDVYQAIDARLFNAIIERSDLCTSANGITRFLPPACTVCAVVCGCVRSWCFCDSSVVRVLSQSQASRSRRPSLTSPSGRQHALLGPRRHQVRRFRPCVYRGCVLVRKQLTLPVCAGSNWHTSPRSLRFWCST